MTKPTVDTTAAEAYESALVPGIFGPWAQAIVEGAGIEPGMFVLDLASGTGAAARFAEAYCSPTGHVVGIDFDAGMVEIARSSSRSPSSRIEFNCASADNLPIATASIDIALCLQGLQFFPDRSRAFFELNRVLKKGGSLIATTWGEIESCKGYWAMVSALESRGIDAAAARKPFSLSSAAELRSLAEASGFTNITVRTECRKADFSSAKAFVDAIAQGAPSSRHALAKVPQPQWLAYLTEVETSLAEWKVGARLQFPMSSNVLTAIR